MKISVELRTKKISRHQKSQYEILPDHVELRERLRKTLYYGKLPETDRPSLPMTEAAVEMFQEVAPRELGKVDTMWASSFGRRACVSPCSLMLGMLYLDRLKNKNPEYLQKVSSSELFLVSMMVASKYLYDEGVDEEVFNDEWAESAKLDVEDVNELERDFLTAIDWNLFVRPADFEDSLLQMEKRIARLKGLEQGYYMYSDLMLLSCDVHFLTTVRCLLQEVCKVVVVCSVAYVAGVLTMVGATLALSCVKSSLTTENTLPSPATPDLASQLSPLLPAEETEGNVSLEDILARSEVKVTEGQLVEDKVIQGHQAPPVLGPSHRHPLPTAQAPGLLMLTLLKDTVIHFMLGIKQQWHGEGVVSEAGSLPGRCGCPQCPGKVRVDPRENRTEQLKASQWENTRDVTKSCVGKLPCRCAATGGSPAKHGTGGTPQEGVAADSGGTASEGMIADGGGTSQSCALPVITSYQVMAPLAVDCGIGFHTMAKTSIVV